MIPGLEEHLINGSEENVIHIAELVCFSLVIGYIGDNSDSSRSRKVPQVPDWMTSRA